VVGAEIAAGQDHAHPLPGEAFNIGQNMHSPRDSEIEKSAARSVTTCGAWLARPTNGSTPLSLPLPSVDHSDQRLELAPCDPVALLHSKVEAVEPAVRSLRPAMVSSLARLRDRIDARAKELRREVPCLCIPMRTSTTSSWVPIV
jgi:hypothetical protein